MFQRIREAGAWLFSSVIEPSELEQFDANQSRAVDGHGGGAYAPSSPIDIGGAGLRVLAPSQADQPTPKGWVENLVSSAISALAAQKVTASSAWYAVSGTATDGSKLTLTASGSTGGTFTLASNEVQVPAAGIWRVRCHADLTNSSSLENVGTGVTLTAIGVAQQSTRPPRLGTASGMPTSVALELIVTITDPGSQRIKLEANSETTSDITASGLLAIERAD